MENKINYNVDLLNWDSDFFNLRIGCIHESNMSHALDDFLHESLLHSYDLIYVDLRNVLSDIPNMLTSYLDVGGKITFSKLLTLENENRPRTNDSHEIVLHSSSFKINNIRHLIEQCANESRFSLDPTIEKRRVVDMYMLWTNKVNKESNNFRIFSVNNLQYLSIDGFALVKIISKNLWKIELICIDKKSQRKGLGSILLDQIEASARKRNVQTLEVSTRLNNQPACNLYRNSGFTLDNSSYLYHARLR